MTIFVFTGPTLPPEDAREILDAVYLPPVSQGDVYLAARQRPRAIGIIDGYFHRVPAVWHKEILWALSQGIRVFGSASMGALRAAELAPFGMQGVGWVFDEFRSGRLEDDDEVAILHSSVQVKKVYPTFSEPMVNIRRTVERAVCESVIADSTGQHLIRIAKKQFYGERTYDRILELAASEKLDRGELERLGIWLQANRVDQKRADAIEMLETMRDQLRGDNGQPQPVNFTFQRTELWNRLRARVRLDQNDVGPSQESDVLPGHPEQEELFRHSRREAMLRWSLLELAEREQIEVDQSILHEVIIEFRSRRGLLESADLERWLDDNDLTMPEFVRLMEDEAKVKRMESWIELESERVLLDVMRLTGQYKPSR